MRKTTYFAVLFLFILALTACDRTQEKGNDSHSLKRPDFGQPERQADIRGLVKSIIGNEVAVIKFERQQRLGGLTNQDDGEDGDTRPSFSMSAGGRMHGMGGTLRGSSMDEDSRAAMLERMKEMSTGEEKITIPVGIKMLKIDTARQEDSQPEMVEANLSDIVQEKMVMIWLDKEITDRNIANFVIIN